MDNRSEDSSYEEQKFGHRTLIDGARQGQALEV